MFRRRGYAGAGAIPAKGMNLFIFLAYLILGAYFINFPFSFFKIPEIVTKFNSWIVFVGGIFMLFGAIYYFKASRRYY